MKPCMTRNLTQQSKYPGENSVLAGNLMPFLRPTRFMTAGNDSRGIIWNIEEAASGEPKVTSARSGNSEGECQYLGPNFLYSALTSFQDDKYTGSRPHFIRFSQDHRHWSADDEVPSAFVITDANG
jgi:hypothetical protein